MARAFAMSIRLAAAFVVLVLPVVARGTITPANVGSLGVRWDVPLGSSVTGTLVVANGFLYVTAWDGAVRALDPSTGAERWRFQAETSIPGGVIAVPGGDVCFGDSDANVYCVNGTDGKLAWQKSLSLYPADAVWSQLATSNGRLFVGIASKGDVPCTHGRLVALSLDNNGQELWTLKTVPDRVCRTDTAVECTTDFDCGGTPCVEGLGAGVTATVAFDATGDNLYMNTVGCYTRPSIGDSDTIFKVEADTGDVVWRFRATPAEQYGYCDADHTVECGTNDDCTGVGGICHCLPANDPACVIQKEIYHDFGFLNGPVRVDLPSAGGTDTLVVSGSKDGTLYALRDDGELYTPAWMNPVQPLPISPGTAGFGLFNGALAYADGRLYAALYQLIPNRVCAQDHRKGCKSDADCGGTVCMPTPPHLMAFDPAAQGRMVWSDDIGPSWSSVAVVNGVVYAGTQAKDESSGRSTLFAYDAATGQRLATYDVPATIASRSAVDGDTVFVGYGVLTAGGVRALSLCGNARIDPGEECDPGAPDTHGCCTVACKLVTGTCDDGNACTAHDTCTNGHCTATITPNVPCPVDDGNVCTDAICDSHGACVQQPNTSACDDGDACTVNDRCSNAQCAGSLDTTAAVGCVVDQIVDAPCGDVPLPPALAKALKQRVAAAHRLLARAAKLAAKTQVEKAATAQTSAAKQVAGIAKITAKAVASKIAKRHISAECKTAIDARADRGRVVLSGLVF